MPDNKNQHFIPQMYLRRFSANGKSVGLINLKTEKIIENAPIKRQCSKSYYYGKNPDESVFVTSEGLGHQLDELEKSVLPRVRSREHVMILHLILTMYSRSEHYRASVAESEKAMLESMLDNSEISEQDIAILRKTISQKGHISKILMAQEGYPICVDLQMGVFVNHSNIEFITSDNPVVVYNPLMCDSTIGTHNGIGSRGIVFLLPITHRVVFVLYDNTSYKSSANGGFYKLKRPFDIQILNALTVLSAEENVYFFSDSNSAAITVRQYGHKRRKIKGNVIVQSSDEYSSFGIYKEPIREKIMIPGLKIKHSARVSKRKYKKKGDLKAKYLRNPELVRQSELFNRRVTKGEYSWYEFEKYLIS